jgi:hypothetical protein
MYAVFANDFSPAIVSMYNASASVIPAGMAVMRTPISAQSVPDVCNPLTAVSFLRGVKMFTANVYGNQQNFIGVAYESIAPSTFGAVCIGGPCQVRISAEATCSTGFAMGVDTTAPGYFVVMAAASAVAMACVPAMVLETQNAVTADGLCNAFIEPVKLNGGLGKFT